MKTLSLALLACIAALAQGANVVCRHTSECEPGECCQIANEFQVVSKRDHLATYTPLPFTIPPPRTGVCRVYILEGARCNVFDDYNYSCNCEPGTSCVREELPYPTPGRLTTHAWSFRTLMPARPGYYMKSSCKKRN